jgi:hypothetical protein
MPRPISSWSGIDPLAFLGGERLRDGDGFHEADDRDQDRRADQARPQSSGEKDGAVSGGRPCGTSPTILTPSFGERERPGDEAW